MQRAAKRFRKYAASIENDIQALMFELLDIINAKTTTLRYLMKLHLQIKNVAGLHFKEGIPSFEISASEIGNTSKSSREASIREYLDALDQKDKDVPTEADIDQKLEEVTQHLATIDEINKEIDKAGNKNQEDIVEEARRFVEDLVEKAAATVESRRKPLLQTAPESKDIFKETNALYDEAKELFKEFSLYKEKGRDNLFKEKTKVNLVKYKNNSPKAKVNLSKGKENILKAKDSAAKEKPKDKGSKSQVKENLFNVQLGTEDSNNVSLEGVLTNLQRCRSIISAKLECATSYRTIIDAKEGRLIQEPNTLSQNTPPCLKATGRISNEFEVIMSATGSNKIKNNDRLFPDVCSKLLKNSATFSKQSNRKESVENGRHPKSIKPSKPIKSAKTSKSSISKIVLDNFTYKKICNAIQSSLTKQDFAQVGETRRSFKSTSSYGFSNISKKSLPTKGSTEIDLAKYIANLVPNTKKTRFAKFKL